jgi:hypothetical protein
MHPDSCDQAAGDANDGDPATMNTFLVGVSNDGLVSLMLNRSFTRAEALNLAVWLLILGDHSREDVEKLRAAVENV